ncbi:MAG: hypothetical protein JWQ71_1705 [Pedosphaera sp.]|nr:hypothetical protein [Pedosphaera sp.]
MVDAVVTEEDVSAAVAKAGAAAPAGIGLASAGAELVSAGTGAAAVALVLAAMLVETSEEALVELLVAALGSARATRLVAVIPMMLSRVALSFILIMLFCFWPLIGGLTGQLSSVHLAARVPTEFTAANGLV